MKTLLTLLAVLLYTSSVQAEETLTITESGYYLTILDSSGVPYYSKINTIVDLRNNTTDTPTTTPPTNPVPPTDPPTHSDLVAQVTKWASTIDDPHSAQAIAAVYAHISEALDDNTLSPGNVWEPLKQSTDSALGVVVNSKDWSEFRDKLVKIFTKLQQLGKLSSSDEIEKVLMSVQKGLTLSANTTELTMDQLVEITRRTNLAIDGVTK